METRPVVLITGTSRGLGRDLAQFFLEKNCYVCGCSRKEFHLGHPGYDHAVVDVSVEGQVRSWIRDIKKEHGRIDVLICNASAVKSTLFLPVTSGELFNEFIKTNINGTFFVAREVSKLMATQKSGRIIAISSTMVPLREKGTAIYSATKSFVTQMIKVLAKELAPVGVTCNLVAPALMQTDSSEKLAEDPAWTNHVLGLQDIQRPITTKEVCHAVDFFLQKDASSITGQVIYLGLVD